MTERQAKILTSLIREHIRTAEPVGSDVLVERYRLPYSSATVRAECSDLEDAGYVHHPHASAGRVPSAHAYRYFVDHEVRAVHPSAADLARFQAALADLEPVCHRLARRAAKLLARHTGHFAVSGIAEREEVHEAGLAELLSEPEFEDGEGLREVSRVIDAIDAQFDLLAHEDTGALRVFIGEENPFTEACHVSVLLTPYTLRSGERGILALIGPTRMRYDRNMSVLARVAQALETIDGGPG